ncbi:2-phospho-L-lactate transferase [soil metagenome]
MKAVALAGGVGGAKLAAGLESALPEGSLSVIVNTADDFDLWGLRICPDLDTVMYTLAGVANPETGWGMAGETFDSLEMLGRYGEDTWFWLGDRDIATHLLRTSRLRSGESLTSVTTGLSHRLGIPGGILPMSDEPVATVLDTPAGELEFQEYFVRRGQSDEVRGVEFRGIEAARPTSEAIGALREADVVVFCPSNPVVSTGPILAVPGMRDAIQASSAPKVAVSPIIGGRALKGPADRMLSSTGYESSAAGVAGIYSDLIDALVMDHVDEGERDEVESQGMRPHLTDAVMRDAPDRTRLAREVLDLARELSS